MGALEVSISKERVCPQSTQSGRNLKRQVSKSKRSLDSSQQRHSLDHVKSNGGYSWCDPVDEEAGPGTYTLQTLFGRQDFNKNNNPSFSFGTKKNWSHIVQDRAQEREKLGNGPPLK